MGYSKKWRTKMKNNMKEIKVIKKNSIGLITEAIILFALLYFVIVSMILPELYKMVEYLIALLLLNMSYNSLSINKKDKVGIIQFIIGIILIVTLVLT